MEMSPFLMTPGPTELPSRVLQAVMRPGVTPGDPAFVETWDETASMLQTILETKNEMVLLPGSGRVAIEAGITSILDPGDRVLTINNGVFGE
jgi:aspartate aminotransferase-like enzyme